MPPYKGYMFSIPSLPQDRYEFLRGFARRYDLTQRQGVILALDALETLLTNPHDTRRVEVAVERVKREHPVRGGRPARVE